MSLEKVLLEDELQLLEAAKNGANIRVVKRDGKKSSAAYAAAYFDSVKTLKILLDTEPDLLEIKSGDNSTPLMCAACGNSPNTVQTGLSHERK